jgi:hypothetical protein
MQHGEVESKMMIKDILQKPHFQGTLYDYINIQQCGLQNMSYYQREILLTFDETTHL